MNRSNKVLLINIFLAIFFLSGLYVFDKLIGGNATNGKIENNIYYVKDSLGKLNIVSKFIYILNYAYTCLTVLFILAGIVSIVILQYQFVNYCKRSKGKIGDLS